MESAASRAPSFALISAYESGKSTASNDPAKSSRFSTAIRAPARVAIIRIDLSSPPSTTGVSCARSLIAPESIEESETTVSRHFSKGCDER